MTLSSTFPGAVAVLVTHFKTVAGQHPTLNAAVYLGPAVGPSQPQSNFIMVGDFQTGALIRGYRQDFRGLPVPGTRKNEDYYIPCTIRTWAGTSLPASPSAGIDRLADAFSLMDGILNQLQNDPQGTNSLTSSGTWQVTQIDIPQAGPLPMIGGGSGGWGVVMTFEVHVFNVTLPSY